MSEETKPGLKIRRKRLNDDQEPASSVEEAANSDTPEGAPAEPRGGAQNSESQEASTEAPHKAPPEKAAPAGPSDAELRRTAKAKPEGRHVHRSEFADTLKPRAEKSEEQVEATRQEAVEDEGPMPSTDDFAAMFGATPPSEIKDYYPGDKADVAIIEITADSIFVDLGPKREGVIDRRDFQNDDGTLDLQIGDTISAYVISLKGGQVQLSNTLRGGDDAIDALSQAAANGIPVDGRVVKTNKGGYEVEIMGKEAFCPHSQIALGYTEDPAVHVGNSYRFKVERVDERGHNIVVSRSALLQAERDEKAAETLKKLEIDAELQGVVTRVADFGAFVDLGGIDGLVHVSQLGWTHVDHPSEVVEVGQAVNVKVIRMEGLGSDLKIALSMKELEEDPFIEAMKKYGAGDTLTGKVTRLAPFGAFIEILPGVDGLCHVSEMAVGQRINHPQDVVQPGDKVEVQIIDTDPRKRTISLSMKRLMDNPWTEAAASLAPGTKVQGTVSNIESFGIFVSLSGGIDALLPLSQLADGEDVGHRKHFSPGTEIEATVLQIEPERQRLTLTRKENENAELDAAVASYKSQQGSESFGTFADLLKKRS